MRRGAVLRCSAAALVSSCAISSHPMPPMSLDVLEPRMVYLKPSSSPHRKPSVLFPVNVDAIPSSAVAINPCDLGTALPTYRIASPSCDYYALRIPLLKAGFRRVPDEASPFSSNIVWGKSAPVTSASPRWDQYVPRNAFQKFNHFPRSHKHLGCKRGMAQSLRRWEASVTQAFTPQTFFYPSERSIIEKVMTEGAPAKRFIWKPARGSCGRGIMISRSGANDPSWRSIINEIDHKASDPEAHEMARLSYSSYVVQEYIEDPLLIDNRKLDLRLYVGVTSFDPLVVYLHTEGLVRFAAEPYGGNSPPSTNSANDVRFKHLTNYSLGRKLEVDQQTSLDLKWPLSKFRSRLDELHGHSHPTLSFDTLMGKAKHAIVETLLSSKRNISSAAGAQAVGSGSDNFLELFGFDIMFDATGNAWLIEVNTLPSLESSSAMDYHIKSSVTTDLLNMAQLELFDRPLSVFETCGLAPPPGSESVVSPSVARRNVGRPDGFIHSDAVGGNQMSDSEKLFDLQMKLKDQETYRGGFERIFPNTTATQVVHHHQVLTEWDYAAADFLSSSHASPAK